MRSDSDTVVPDMSVVIPCYRQSGELVECLRSVLSQQTELLFEVIVVNSEPSPDVEDIVSNMAGVKLVSNNARLYPASARNLGARQSKADIIVFFDADVTVDPNWLDLAYNKFKDGHCCIGGSVTNRYFFHPIEFVDNILQFSDFTPARKSEVTDVLPVCNIAIKKAVFDEVNGFIENSLTSGEDVLFCKKVYDKYPSKMFFYNSLIVKHKGRSDLISLLRHQYLFGFSRGYLGLSLKYGYRKLGKKFIMLVPVIIKRLMYIINTNLRMKPVNVLCLIIFSPVLISGLISWAWGFYRGCASEH